MALQIGYVGSNVPRDNHYEIPNGQTVPVRTLLMEQRKGNHTYSNDFSNAAYTKDGSTVAITAETNDPEDAGNAWLVSETATTGVHEIRRAHYTGSNSSWGWSVFVKPKNRTFVRMEGYGGSGTPMRVTFNLSDGTYVESAGSGVINSVRMIPYANGWYRICVHWRIPSFGNSTAYLKLGSNSTTFSYAGNTGFGLYVWGWQADDFNGDGSVNYRDAPATSYIPTVASGVYRAHDALSFPIDFTPQDLSIYMRGVFIGIATSALVRPTLVQLGLFGLPNFNFGMRLNGSRIEAYFDNIGGTAEVVSQSATGVALPGNQIEAVLHYTHATRVVRITTCVGYGTIVAATPSASAGGTSPANWENPVLIINGNNTITDRTMSVGYQNVVVAREIRTMEQMRQLAGVVVPA